MALAVALFATWAFVVEPVGVAGSSMEPTLRSGDHVFVDKLTYRSRDPRPGEIVVLHQPEGRSLGVKRVVGAPGDRVAVEDGVLVVNGVARREAFVDLATVDSEYFGPVTVEPGTVFVMGDNRGDSIDSRRYGAVPIGDVVGRVVWTLRPPWR